MNRHLLRAGACYPNSRRLQAFCESVLPDLALAFTAVLLPTAFAWGAVLSSDIKPAVAVGQVDAVLPRATLLAPPLSGPARAEVLQQLYTVLPRAGLLATALPRAPGIAAVTQPPVAGRLALHTPVLKPGQGPVLAEQGLNVAACADANSRAECRLLQDRAPDWRVATAVEIDPVSGAALVPGVTWNPPPARYKLDEVLTYLASVSARPARVGPMSSSPEASPTAGGDATPSGSSTRILVIPTSIFNLIMNGEYNNVTVDLASASEASYVTGLTLSSHNTLLLMAAPGSALQLNNVTLAAGSPAQQNSMVLSNALNGFISVLGGATDGTGITKVATVKALSVLQSGAWHILLLGLNGTTGAVTTVLQSGKAQKTLKFDNETNDMVINASQTGNSSHTATGIGLKAGQSSSFVLRQL